MKYLIYSLVLCSYGLFFMGCTGNTNTNSQAENEKEPTMLEEEELLTLIQQQTFNYFWDGAEVNSGMARERYHQDEPSHESTTIAIGGSGFGVMAILVGIERGFITRQEGVDRLEKIVDFLEKSARFHGVWPHWIYGENGQVRPFSKKDDGGDLVETSYLMQGLLCVRQYFKEGNPKEKQLADQIDRLWRDVEWNWYRGEAKENVLFWHWSPKYNWEMNFRIRGYNECLITYILAASSPTHPIPPAVYHEGWAQRGAINGETTKYGYTLEFKHQGAPEYGGPLFWAHYSFLGLNPRNLSDRYGNYWTHNKNHILIDRQYCIENPLNYKGYSEQCWGLTSSYSPEGYKAHKPAIDLGVISPTAALASYPYTPEYSLQAAQYFYHELGDKLWGPFGFYDAFSIHKDWYPKKYLAIDQGPIIVMIENHRTGLLWNLFMSCPEVQTGLTKLGFTFNE